MTGSYRKDIDGLRAIAVLSVLFYHSTFQSPSGGFVGVDIFFVISGYLISGILKADLDGGRFSLLRFYERRARRILPALSVVLVVTCAFAWIFLLPTAFEAFGRSLVAATLFSSNFLFWAETDYFAAPENTLPLLHTWSLAVEEQFYLVVPIALYLIHRYARSWQLPATWLAAIVSFAISVLLVRSEPAGAFYLPHARAWEFLLGALVAFGAFPKALGRWTCEILAWLGVALLVAGMTLIDEHSAFPGVNALAPCIGAALLIHAGEARQTLPARILSTRLPVFIGLISYSLYLWHWPIFVFADQFRGNAPTQLMSVGLCLLSIGIAYLSWRYIEQPWRSGRSPFSRRTVAFSSTGAVALCSALGLAIVLASGAPQRFSPEVVAIDRFLNPENTVPASTTKCLHASGGNPEQFIREHCLTPAADKPNYLLIGDSHAAHFAGALRAAFPDIHFLQASTGGCRPLLAFGDAPHCQAIIGTALNEVLPGGKVDAVILSARWADRFLPDLSATIAYIRKYARRVYVLGPIVIYRGDLPDLIIHELHFGETGLIKHRRRTAIKPLDAQMKRVTEEAGGIYISTYKTICSADDCEIFAAPGVPMQFDDGHLTGAGADLIVQRWKSAGLLP